MPRESDGGGADWITSHAHASGALLGVVGAEWMLSSGAGLGTPFSLCPTLEPSVCLDWLAQPLT